jgi:hypothetical protein
MQTLDRAGAPERHRRGVTVHEFALWLNLQDVYWAKQGHKRVDIAIGAAGVFPLVAIGAPV